MFKPFLFALVPVIGLHSAYAETTPVVANLVPGNAPFVRATCEESSAPSRSGEPCASYWATVQAGMTDCMATVAHTMPANRARYLFCVKLVREKYLAEGQ